MDAKSKANFINSVASGQKVPCPVCNALNEPDSLFCFSCGTKLEKKASTNETLPFRTAAPVQQSAPIQQSAPVQKAAPKQVFQIASPVLIEEPEETSVFAEGLPAWDMLPPQVAVRRNKK